MKLPKQPKRARWFSISTKKKITPLSRPIRSKTKTDHDALRYTLFLALLREHRYLGVFHCHATKMKTKSNKKKIKSQEIETL